MASSQADLDEIEALLDEIDRLSATTEDGEYAPLPGGVDGFLTALVALPEQVPQEEWLAALFNGAEQLLPESSVQRLSELLLARKATIAGQLTQGHGGLEPLFEVDERHDEVLWQIWIEGFDQAMRLRHEAWMALLDEEADAALAEAVAELVLLIGIASGELKSRKLHRLDQQIPRVIPFLAEVIYRRSRGLAMQTVRPQRQEPLRSAKVGRNDPCPCGSGAKYKKCCGR